MIVVLVPELQRTFDASPGAVTAGLTAYLLPFAALQLVSGTIGERLGRGRDDPLGLPRLRRGLVRGRAGAGDRAVPRPAGACRARRTRSRPRCSSPPWPSRRPTERLGRSMGTFASVQTAGMVMAPLCGGLLGAIEPRLAFAVPGVVALLLAAAPLPARRPRPARDARAPARRVQPPLDDGRDRRASSPTSRSTASRFLVALRAADPFGLDATERGLLLAGFGFAGRARGPAGGRARRPLRAAAGRDRAARCSVRRWSRRSASRVGGAAGARVARRRRGLVVRLGRPQHARGAERAANRGGAISVVGAFKFAGQRRSPRSLWLPLYMAREETAFAAAAVACAGDRARRRSRSAAPRARRRRRRRPRPRAAAAAHTS